MPDVDEPMAYCIGCGDMLDAIDIVAGERVCPRCASRDLMESMLPSESDVDEEDDILFNSENRPEPSHDMNGEAQSPRGTHSYTPDPCRN